MREPFAPVLSGLVQAMRQTEEHNSFHMMQVLSDLRSAAISGFSNLAESIGDASKPALRRVVFEHDCLLPDDVGKSLHGDLMMTASLPDKNHAAFITATVILVADRLQDGTGQDDLFWNWSAFQERYREAAAPVRAALMNGFRCAHDMQLARLENPPKGRDLRTYDEDDLVRLLKLIARNMSANLRNAVCDLAPEETKTVHQKALTNCLKHSCILSEFGGWFPKEVVELASLDTEHPAHPACTALMLIDAISTEDATGRMADLYETMAEDYYLMREEIRVPVVAALRHLHELDSAWEPYADWSPETRLNKAIVMPFAKS